MKKLVLGLMLLLAVTSYCSGNGVNVVFDVYTQHFEKGYPYNENNKMVGIEFENIMLSSFTNSYGDQSMAVSYNIYYKPSIPGELYLGLGAALGYRKGVYRTNNNGVAYTTSHFGMINDDLSLVAYVGYDILGVNIIYFPSAIKVLYKVRVF